VNAILAALDELYPSADCELQYRNPFELVCATILSAQCTDKRVNMVTPQLFARFPDAFALAKAKLPELESIIRTTGFYRNKAKSLQGMARVVVSDFGGEIPRTMAELLRLPGVARKTANVVLGTAYGLAEGVVVDTHIARLSGRLRLTRHDDPVKIEKDLMARIPRDRWIRFGHQLIWHGRRVCAARRPACDRCRMAPLCPSAELPRDKGNGRRRQEVRP
jgi:endonuclease-3